MGSLRVVQVFRVAERSSLILWYRQHHLSLAWRLTWRRDRAVLGSNERRDRRCTHTRVCHRWPKELQLHAKKWRNWMKNTWLHYGWTGQCSAEFWFHETSHFSWDKKPEGRTTNYCGTCKPVNTYVSLFGMRVCWCQWAMLYCVHFSDRLQARCTLSEHSVMSHFRL